MNNTFSSKKKIKHFYGICLFLPQDGSELTWSILIPSKTRHGKKKLLNLLKLLYFQNTADLYFKMTFNAYKTLVCWSSVAND